MVASVGSLRLSKYVVLATAMTALVTAGPLLPGEAVTGAVEPTHLLSL